MSKSFFRTTSLWLSGPIVLWWAASALAQEPSCDLDCIKGYSCELQISGCPDLLRDDRPCEPTSYPSCVAQLCSSDADCASRMRCYDGNTPGDVRQCLPQHSFPCSADSDCGAGFTCAPLNPCLDPAKPDCVPDAPEDGKVCWITETRACQADSECLPDWTCENNPRSGRSFGESGTVCVIGDPPLVCMPPYSSIFGRSGAAGFLDWAKGVERTSTRVPESECPEPTSPYVSYGKGGGIDEQGEGPVTMANPTSAPGPSGVDNDSSAASGGGGCSLSLSSTGHAGRGLGLTLLLGLACRAVGRRRRTSAAQKRSS